jgi:hypothetical protein
MEYFLDDQIVFDLKTLTENDLRQYMLSNTDTIVGLAESFVDYQVETGKMAQVECLYHPLFDNIFDLVERLGIREAVTETMRNMMEEEERALQNFLYSAS